MSVLVPLTYVLSSLFTALSWKSILISVIVAAIVTATIAFGWWMSLGSSKSAKSVVNQEQKDVEATTEEPINVRNRRRTVDAIFGPSDFMRSATRMNERETAKVANYNFDEAAVINSCPDRKEASFILKSIAASTGSIRELLSGVSSKTVTWFNALMYKGKTLRQLITNDQEGLLYEAANYYYLRVI